jgi:uncharacterized protein YbaP (TraB family)
VRNAVRRGATIATAAVLAALCTATRADNAPPPVQDWTVETVVVTAKKPGPAFWHIANGKSDVWIIGTLGPVPDDLNWDTGRLQYLLTGAKVLLLPPRGQVGPLEGIWFLITSGDVLRQPDGTLLESTLPPPLKARFIAVRNNLHKDADDYSEYKASVAGFILERDFLRANDLSASQPLKTIEGLAERATVPSRRVATYEALDVIKEVPSLSNAGNWTCMKDSLDDIDVMGKHARPAAEAWATGDLDGIKAHYSDPRALDCLGQSASFSKLWARGVNDTLSALNAALKSPGKTIAVVSIGELLRKNGIVDRLKAEGFTVDGPGD